MKEVTEKEKALAGLVSSAILFIGQLVYAVFQMVFAVLSALAR